MQSSSLKLMESIKFGNSNAVRKWIDMQQLFDGPFCRADIGVGVRSAICLEVPLH